MKLSRIAILAIFCVVGLRAQKATNPLEDHTSYDSYSKDSETRKRQEDLKSIGRGNPKERLEHAFADVKSLDEQIAKLNQLSEELKTALANSDSNVFSKAALKHTEEIEKLAKDIKVRMKRAAMVAQVD